MVCGRQPGNLGWEEELDDNNDFWYYWCLDLFIKFTFLFFFQQIYVII